MTVLKFRPNVTAEAQRLIDAIPNTCTGEEREALESALVRFCNMGASFSVEIVLLKKGKRDRCAEI